MSCVSLCIIPLSSVSGPLLYSSSSHLPPPTSASCHRSPRLMRRSSMGPLGGGPGRRRRPKLVTAHHKTYVGDTSETPSSTFAFLFCADYGASAPIGTGRGNQVTSSSDQNYCPNYCQASRANKFRGSSRSRPDSGWALLGARRNFARGRFSNGRPAPRSQVANELAERQRSRSASGVALRGGDSWPTLCRRTVIRRMRPQHGLRPPHVLIA